ncbi:cold-shock protein [Aureitalea marina]|uniref:Cold-shock protein n=1 Tax=Aureitalea marina TaxID=930804 RepID=A0A2S7KTA2_9FLAO|nr:cold shock domain-containing protein [Aureitalea marina]PQB05855.1 cold-shock protein [Aureitalea marina]
MQKGTVKFFNNSKGFGFITSEESQEDIFVHITGLVDEVRDGDEVTFETAQGKKGLNAVNVRLA